MRAAHIDRLIAVYQDMTPESVAMLSEVYAANAFFKDPFNEVNGIDRSGAGVWLPNPVPVPPHPRSIRDPKLSLCRVRRVFSCLLHFNDHGVAARTGSLRVRRLSDETVVA